MYWFLVQIVQPFAILFLLVVLSGSIRPPDSIRARTELGPDTLYRCLHAVELFRRG